MFRMSTVLIAIILSVSMPVAASGDNVVSNGTFNVDVADWIPRADATIDWSPLDAAGNPGSGSGLVANIANIPTAMGANQCANGLEGGKEYVLQSMIYIPGGQANTGNGYISIRLYDQPDCQGNQILSDFSSQVYTTTPDQWLESSRMLAAPQAAQSALVWLSVTKNEDVGSLDMAFDNVSLSAIEIFVDGFESGDTSVWSNMVP